MASEQLAAGDVDISLVFPTQLLIAADAGDPLVGLAGVQVSPWVLFGNDRVQSLRDLKGKRIYIYTIDVTDPAYSFFAALLAYVGIDIDRDVELVQGDLLQLALAGTIDAWTVTRPNATVVFGANKIGHVVIDGLVDPPWSQHFGVMATGNGDFVERNPVATKRALRAILKGADVCAREPERAAHYLVDNGFTPFDYDLTLAGIPAPSYAAWREFNPDDTLRFYALRLKDAGLVTSTPDELIARATDWRYLDQIKRELGV